MSTSQFENTTHIGHSLSPMGKPIEHFQVFGERRSGTNYVASLLLRNTNLQEKSIFGWKHGIPSFPVFPASCLFVVVVREPVDWFKALYRAPFEVDPRIAELPFPDFIRAEWESIYTPRKSGWRGHGYSLDFSLGRRETLQLDRHPIEGRKYRNIVELRNMKLAGQLSLLNRDLNCIAVTYEAVRDDFNAFLSAVRDNFDVGLHAPSQAVKDHVGPRSPRLDRDTTLGPSDVAFILENLNLHQERKCGFLTGEHER